MTEIGIESQKKIPGNSASTERVASELQEFQKRLLGSWRLKTEVSRKRSSNLSLLRWNRSYWFSAYRSHLQSPISSTWHTAPVTSLFKSQTWTRRYLLI